MLLGPGGPRRTAGGRPANDEEPAGDHLPEEDQPSVGIASADLVIFAVPSAHLRERRAGCPALSTGADMLSLVRASGGTLMRMSR